jgi:PAS domain S-box-containing protein
MGSAEEPAGTPLLTTLFTSLVEESADAIVVVSDDGSIHYMNAVAGAVTGLDPAEARGCSCFDLLHPNDVDRAIFDLGVHSAPGAPPGWSTFRIRSADGSWLPMQVTTAEVTDGSTRLLATFWRTADVSSTEALFGLLRGTPPVDALTPVLDMFNRRVFGSLVAIAWSDDDGLHHVGSEVPAAATRCSSRRIEPSTGPRPRAGARCDGCREPVSPFQAPPGWRGRVGRGQSLGALGIPSVELHNRPLSPSERDLLNLFRAAA